MRLRIFAFLIFSALLGSSVHADAQGCDAPDPVCSAVSNVVAISGYEPIGSAVVLGGGVLVTNRHMVADRHNVTVFMKDGKREDATVVPTDYPGDLILLRSGEFEELEPLAISRPLLNGELYVIGFDLGREAIRVYSPGRMIVDVAETPLARLHMDAAALPGNSGGAVVDALGNLVGIVASGGEGRNEAIPATELDKLRDASGPDKETASLNIGQAYRLCIEALGDDSATREQLIEPCLESANRQLMDLAGQTLGKRRDVEGALILLEESYEQDPNAPNTIVSLAITYHIAQRWADEIPVLKRGLDILPDDIQLLRLALQAGIWGGDQELADFAMGRIEAVIPQMAPAARRFYDDPPTVPRVRPPG